MGTHRDIPVHFASDVAGDVAHAIGEMYEPGTRIQHVEADMESATFTAVPETAPHDILQRVKESLVECSKRGDEIKCQPYPDQIPDDPDAFGVVAVKLEVDDLGFVTIVEHDK